MAELAFEVVDVFTDTAFAGNPLAVVLGGESLTTAQMQAVAGEFNLSETTFPLRPTPGEAARGVDYRLRIFTAGAELPFAGHPSVGTAWMLAQRGVVSPGRVVQACGAGDLPLEVAPDGGRVRLTGGTPTLGASLDADLALAAAGLGRPDLVRGDVPTAGTGLEFGYLFVHPGALARAVPDLGAQRRLAAGGSHLGLSVVVWPGAGGGSGASRDPVRCRVFAGDIAEDPATGSAALGLSVAAVAQELLPGEGSSTFDLWQGVEMGRPSVLHLEVDAVAGRAVEARVSGDVVRVSRGWIAVPT